MQGLVLQRLPRPAADGTVCGPGAAQHSLTTGLARHGAEIPDPALPGVRAQAGALLVPLEEAITARSLARSGAALAGSRPAIRAVSVRSALCNAARTIRFIRPTTGRSIRSIRQRTSSSSRARSGRSASHTKVGPLSVYCPWRAVCPVG